MNTSSPHIAKVQQMYAAFGRGDIPALLAELSADVEWRINVDLNAPGAKRVPLFTPRRGHPGVGAFFAELAQGIEIHRFEPASFLSGDSEVAVRLRVEYTVRSTGKRANVDAIHHFTFDRNGHVTRFIDFFDTLGDAAAWGAV